MRKPRKNGFTLIEMLTVIVIIVIVLSIGVPAFTNLMKSGGLSGASREVANALGLARQYAITHRTTTQVVFSYSGTQVPPLQAASTNRCPWYQSYAVVDAKAGTYISKWDHLPMGTVFMNGNNTSLSAPRPLGLEDLLLTTTIPFPTNSSPFNATLACIEFQPTGAATQAGTITITEGLVNSGTIVNPVIPTSKAVVGGNTLLANQSVISVDSIIGRIQVTRP